MNKEEIIFITLAIQVAIQVALYLGTCKIFRGFIRRPVLAASMAHKMWGMTRQAAANAVVGVLLLAYNIAISAVVLHFTSSSALAGITNMGASVLVAILMFVEFSSVGRFYIEVPKENALKKMLNKLKIGKGERNGDN